MVEPLDLGTVEIRGGPLVLASHPEVDDMEARLGVAFPDGYHEYVTQLGEGSLNTLVRVLPPWRVVAELDEHRGMMAAAWFWESGKVPFDQEEAMESIQLADTLNGDVIAFHPSARQRIVILPRNRERLYARGPDLLEMINWVCSGGVLHRFGPSRYFEPFDSRTEAKPARAASPSIASRAADPLGAPAPDAQNPRDHLLGYFAALRDVEEWVVKTAGVGPEAFRGEDPPDLGDAPEASVARSDAVHARYCTPRFAASLSGSSVTITWPPVHEPTSIRIVDERETRPGRVLIRTSLGSGAAADLIDYGLERNDGGWRISSHRYVGLDDSEPPPSRPSFLSRLLGRS